MGPEEIALALAGPLTKLIADEIADGQKSEREATAAALHRLAEDVKLTPILPTIQKDIDDARRPAAERDADKK